MMLMLLGRGSTRRRLETGILGCGAALFTIAGAAGAEVIYDNTTRHLTNFYSAPLEFGDLIRFDSATNELTEFSFEYFGDFVPTGNETVHFRIYANDGPDTDPSPTRVINAPGTLLYEAKGIPIGPGYNAVSFPRMGVRAPRFVSWTVEFGGLQQVAGNKAGLVFFGPLSEGTSFDDFWRHDPDGWRLYGFRGNPIANFGAKALAGSSVPLTSSPPETLPDGRVRIGLTGRMGQSLEIRFATDNLSWKPLARLTMTSDTGEYIHEEAAQYTERYYWVVPLEETLQGFHSVRFVSGEGTWLGLHGPAGEPFEIQTSLNMNTWLTIASGNFPDGFLEYLHPITPVPTRYFRLKQLLPAPEFAASISGFAGRVFKVALAGKPGKRVVIEASSNLTQWMPISTNTFSFAYGTITLVDSHASEYGERFYRAVHPP